MDIDLRYILCGGYGYMDSDLGFIVGRLGI